MKRMTRLAETARRRVRGEEVAEEGFTLIELLVVLLIIGILLAIAIPTFLSVTNSANNTAAQSNLQTSLTGAKTFYTQQNQTYSGLCGANGTANTGACPVNANTSGIQGVDVGISAVGGGTASTGPHIVSFETSNDSTTVVMVAQAAGKKDCWGIYDTTTTGHFGTITGPATVYFVAVPAGGTPATCSATTFFTPATNAGVSTGTTYNTSGFGTLKG